MSEFTQGVCSDGAAILRHGVALTPEQIIAALDRGQDIARNSHKNFNAFNEVNNLCWESKAKGKTSIPIDEILEILEKHCD